MGSRHVNINGHIGLTSESTSFCDGLLISVASISMFAQIPPFLHSRIHVFQKRFNSPMTHIADGYDRGFNSLYSSRITIQRGTPGVIIAILTRRHYREAGRKTSLSIPIFLRFMISSVIRVSIRILDENKHRNQRNKRRLTINA